MAVELNHTIVHARDNAASASFYTEILGLPPAVRLYHFMVVRLANGVSLDFMETTEEIQTQHYAFLVSEAEFDAIFERVKQREMPSAGGYLAVFVAKGERPLPQAIHPCDANGKAL